MVKRFLFLLLFLSMGVFAADNVYKIDDINVSFTESNALKARDVAIHNAEMIALKRVLQNLNISSSNAVLIDKNDLPQAIKLMKIRNEKMTTNTYSATIDVEFSPEYLHFLLNKNKVTRYTPTLNTYLIIPFYNKDGKMLLLEKNELLTYFNNALINKKIKNMFAITDDAYTKNSLKSVNKSGLKYSNYKNLADYYSVNNLVFIFADSNKKSYNADLFLVRDNGVEKKTYKSDNIRVVADTLEYLTELDTNNNNDVTDLEKIDIEDGYIALTISINSLGELMEVEKLLEYNDNIALKQLRQLTKKSVTYHVKLSGDRENFINSLKRDRFVVSEKGDNIYVYL